MARRDSLLRPSVSLIRGSRCVRRSFDADFTAGRNPDLALRHDPFAGQALENRFKLALDRPIRALYLPSRKVTAHVLDYRVAGGARHGAQDTALHCLVASVTTGCAIDKGAENGVGSRPYEQVC